MSTAHERVVEAQFGPRAKAYVESAVHSQGADLEAIGALRDDDAAAALEHVRAIEPRLVALLERFGLPVKAPHFPREVWLEYMGRDKKNEGGRITLILLDALGRAAIVKDAPARALEEFLEAA